MNDKSNDHELIAKPGNSDQEQFDKQACFELDEQYGGLAGWYCKQQNNGGWDIEKVDAYMIKLYENRHLLKEVTTKDERIRLVLSVFAGDPKEAMLDRLEAKWRSRIA